MKARTNQARETAHPGGASAADGAIEIDARQILGGALAERAVDGRRQLLPMQIDPVNDAVLGMRQLLLDLPGRVVGIDAQPQRAKDGEEQIDRTASQEAVQRQLAGMR